MLRRGMVLTVVAVVICGAWLGQAVSQPRREGEDRPGGDARRSGRGRGDRGDFQSRIEEFRRRMSEQMREQLGANEQEWKVLQPRIEKVQQLQRQSRGGFRGFGGRFGRRGRGRDSRRPEGAPEREQSDIEKKTEALRNLLDDEASGAPAIKAALGALRKAREKSQLELAAARKGLRDVVTMRQEARLVLMGILD